MVIIELGAGPVHVKPNVTQRLIDSMDAVKFPALSTDGTDGDVMINAESGEAERVSLERIVTRITEDGNHSGEIVQIMDGGYRRGAIIVPIKNSLEMEEFLEHWSIKFKSENILISS